MVAAKIIPVGFKSKMLTVIGPAPHRGASKRRAVRVRCDCGTEFEMAVKHLGETKSCGCESSRLSGMRAKSRAIHGATGTTEHRIWIAMRSRCRDKNNRSYPKYGGRGIDVCPRWNDFTLFLADMGPRPSPNHSIDRIDNERGYSPDNCRWATNKQQMRNRSNTPRVKYQGKVIALRDVADILGLHCNTLLRRYHQGDRPPHLFRPLRGRA